MPRSTIPIYADNDFEELAALRKEVAVAERHAHEALAMAEQAQVNARLGDDIPVVQVDNHPEVVEARRAFNEKVTEAAERAEEWIIEHVGATEFRQLVAAHPPRKVDGEGADEGKQVTHPDDRGFEVNTETFAVALLMFVDPEDPEIRTVVKAGDVDVKNPTELRRRIKRLSAGQLDTLWIAAHGLNTGGISDPKMLRYSTTPTSTET